jgi:hypothetical protein
MPPKGRLNGASPDPLAVLKEAIKAVPAVRYALGVVGIAAAASLIRAYFSSTRIAIYATLAVLGLMILLWAFAQLARLPEKWLKYPSLVVAWSLLGAFACMPILLVSSVFFDKPKPFVELRYLLDAKHPKQPTQTSTQSDMVKTEDAAKFAGTITETGTDLPLSGVRVRLKPGGPIIATTDSHGLYGFSQKGLVGARITVIFEADGHELRTESVYPSDKLDFQLRSTH